MLKTKKLFFSREEKYYVKVIREPTWKRTWEICEEVKRGEHYADSQTHAPLDQFS